MSRTVLGAALMVVTMAAGVAPARASTWGGGVSYCYPSYYYSPPPVVRYWYPPVLVYVQPAPICSPPTFQPVGPGYAKPFAAPPSKTGEPPLDKKALPPPKVTETRSFSLTAVEVTGKGLCRVGFWNISGRDVSLTVSGKAVVVPANRNVTLTVSREFSWQVDGQTTQQERVAEDKAAHEIVIR
jgi:hypothetical protein